MKASASRLVSLARGVALFFGAYSLLGLAVNLVTPRFDPNLLWIDLRFAPSWLSATMLMLFGLIMANFALRSRANVAARLLVWTFAAIAAFNASVFWWLQKRGAIHSTIPVPISLVVFITLAWLARMMPKEASRARPIAIICGALACAIAFPFLQVFGFGKTEYRRQADVAVVFGARVYANGELSDALRYRVRTAARLYRQGRVQRLMMSGGAGNGLIHETDAMRSEAIRLGVPPEAISVDREGLNTAATVRNTLGLARSSRIVAVSEFYHLPRIKMAYSAAGVNITTVPAEPAHWARRWAPMNVAREIPAFWVYYLRAATAKV